MAQPITLPVNGSVSIVGSVLSVFSVVDLPGSSNHQTAEVDSLTSAVDRLGSRGLLPLPILVIRVRDLAALTPTRGLRYTGRPTRATHVCADGYDHPRSIRAEDAVGDIWGQTVRESRGRAPTAEGLPAPPAGRRDWDGAADGRCTGRGGAARGHPTAWTAYSERRRRVGARRRPCTPSRAAQRRGRPTHPGPPNGVDGLLTPARPKTA